MAINKRHHETIFEDLKRMFGEDIDIKKSGSYPDDALDTIKATSNEPLNDHHIKILSEAPVSVQVKRSGKGLTVTYF